MPRRSAVSQLPEDLRRLGIPVASESLDGMTHRPLLNVDRCYSIE